MQAKPGFSVPVGHDGDSRSRLVRSSLYSIFPSAHATPFRQRVGSAQNLATPAKLGNASQLAEFSQPPLDNSELGERMLEALQINFALWRMIICVAMKAAQWAEYAF